MLTVTASTEEELWVGELTAQVQQAMNEYFVETYFSDFIKIELTTLDVTDVRRRLQNGKTAVRFGGDATFQGDVNQNEVWATQRGFLQEYGWPSYGNAQVDQVYLEGDAVGDKNLSSSVNGNTDNVFAPPEGNDQASSGGSFTAYGTVISILVVGMALATIGGIYYIRRSRGTDGYHSHQNESLLYDDIDPEDSTTLAAKPDLEVDTDDHGLIVRSLTSPTTPGSVATDESVSPVNDASAGVADESIGCQSSLVSGAALTSVVEEQSYEVSAEDNEEFVAEVGDDNINVSLMADADEEFVAVSASNKPSTTTTGDAVAVDPKMYANWVGPLLRQLDDKARDCCLKGATNNVLDTSMPHDLMITDMDLAQQRDIMEKDDDPVVSDLIKSDEMAGEAPIIIKSHPTDEEFEQSLEVHEDGDEDDNEKPNEAMRILSGKYHGQPAALSRNSSVVISEGDSSLNLSHQASFMTDDMSVGAELLEKALRDVTLYNPEEEVETELQVAEYIHQVRREAKEYQKKAAEENAEEVQL